MRKRACLQTDHKNERKPQKRRLQLYKFNSTRLTAILIETSIQNAKYYRKTSFLKVFIL